MSQAQGVRRALKEAPMLRTGLVRTVLLALVGSTAQVAIPVLIQQVIDTEIIGGSPDIATVLFAGAVALAVVVVGSAALRAALIRLARVSSEGLSHLRVAVFGELIRRTLLGVQAERRGVMVSRVTSDITSIQEFTEWGGAAIIVYGAQILGTVVAMFVYEWRMAGMIAVALTLYVVMLIWFQRILGRRHDQVRRVVAESLGVVSESVAAIPVIRAHGVEETTRQKVDRILEKRFRTEFRTARFGHVLFASAEVFSGLVTAGVLAVGLTLGQSWGMTAGTLLAFLFLVNLLIDPLLMLVEMLEPAQSAAAGLRRVTDALDSTSDTSDVEHPVELPPGSTEIATHGLGITYPDGTEALMDVDVTIESGWRVAVVGETGSGKTTFAKVLLRFLVPTTGSVVIGGYPLEQIAEESLRRRIAYVPQEGFLWDTTIAGNLRYGNPRATEREMETAFLELGLDDWLAGLPNGLDTEVGERGGNLSAGERQLVALVRAWISGAAMYVLDEATSAVDPALDVKIRHAIERITAGRTSLTIAHRLATAQAADRILVFDEGRVVEDGNHTTLLANNGAYASLYADWTAGVEVS